MKTKTRILSALLTVFLLLSALATGSVAAEEAAKPGDVLYEEDFTPLMERLGWKYDTQGYTGKSFNLSLADTYGKAGNKSMHFTETAGGWCGIEIVPAEKMAGVMKYSISADMMYSDAITFSFRFGDPANKGDVVGISWSTILWNALTSVNNDGSANYTGDKIGKNKDLNLRAEIDAGEGTVVVYINGEEVSRRSDATQKVGAIFMIVRSLDAYMDNICVKNEATGTVIYAEDFENVRDIYTGNDSDYNQNFTDKTTVVPKDGVLNIDRSGDSYSEWGNLREIMPAGAVEGVEQYVISFDLKVIQGDWDGSWTHGIFMGWGAGGNAKRNLVQFHTSYDGDDIKGVVPTTEILYHSAYKSSVNRNLRIRIEVNAAAKTSTIWVNDMKHGTMTNANFTNGGFSIGAAYHSAATVDNLCVTAGTVSDLYNQLRYLGVQESAVKDGTYAVRFVGALGDDVALADYSEVGFKVTATWGADGTKTLDTACSTVYGKITGSADGVTSEYRADSFGAKYLFALAVEGIPTDAGQITFTVTPYYVTAAGTVTGNACTVIYNAGALVSQTAN